MQSTQPQRDYCTGSNERACHASFGERHHSGKCEASILGGRQADNIPGAADYNPLKTFLEIFFAASY
jgi:hypothetical protein